MVANIKFEVPTVQIFHSKISPNPSKRAHLFIMDFQVLNEPQHFNFPFSKLANIGCAFHLYKKTLLIVMVQSQNGCPNISDTFPIVSINAPHKIFTFILAKTID